jgi:hypothetical protein
VRHHVNRKRTLGCKHEAQVAHGWHAWRATVTTDEVLGRLYSASGHKRNFETLCVNSYCFISTIIGLSMSLTRITTVFEGLSVRLLPKCGVFGGV